MVDLAVSDIHTACKLRRCILLHLYTWFKEYPRAAFELRQLHDTCASTNKAFNWNMVYLEKKGWIELDTSAECPPYVACTAVITGTGIDLVEDVHAFDDQLDMGSAK